MSKEEFFAGITALVRVQTRNVLDVDDLAVMLNITPNRVRHMVSQRMIPHYKRNNRLYFKKTEIEDWLTTHRIATNDEINAAAVTRCATNKRQSKIS